jgi:hypothetical protein
MERLNPPTLARGSDASVDVDGAPALRDADGILARAAADETAADEAREDYRTQPMAVLAADDRIAPLLRPDEDVLAVRRSAMLERREALASAEGPIGLAGDLYLTSRRLVFVGRRTVSFDLGEIAEAMLAGDRLLLVMRDGQGASLGVAQPRLLRVEIAAARASGRD